MRKNPAQQKNRGFTLIEMALTLAVGSVVTLAGLSILALAVRYFAVTTRSLQADAELMTALQVLKEHLMQAVDARADDDDNCIATLNHVNNTYVNGNISEFRGHGLIRNCDTTLLTPGQSRYLAIFNAELGQVNNRLKSVSIAFIAPGVVQNGYSRSGALYLTRLGSPGLVDPGGNQPVDLRPNSGSVVFTDLVAANVDEVRVRSEGADQGRVINVTSGEGMAVSAKITLTRRIFMDSELSRRWYCSPIRNLNNRGNCQLPPGVGGDIRLVSRYVDRSRSISVTFRNNLQLERNVGGVAGGVMRKRTFGNIYYFRPITPSF